MAMNLTARLSLVDRFSDPMRRINRHMNTAERAMRSLDDRTRRTGRSVNNFGSGLRRLGGMTKGLFGIKSAFMGIAGAIGSAVAAKKIFDSTVLAAAKHEQSTVMINAMINDKDISKQYMDLIDKISVNSPLMNSQDMYANSKSFLMNTKDLGQLEKMWNLAERMAAIDPVQGVEGSVFALREMFSGDAMSMIERFEMPRAVMNDIKKMDVSDQLVALDEFFNKIGMTNRLITDMGDTTLGKWQQVKEQFQLILRDMGQPSLDVLSGFLDKVKKRFSDSDLDGQIYFDIESGMNRVYKSDLTKFSEWGGRVIENILSGLSSGMIKVYDYFSGLSSDPAFQAQTTLFGKLTYIFGDFFAAYQKWLTEDGGQEAINNAMKNLLEVGSAALLASKDMIVSTATTIGTAIGSAMYEAAKEGMVSKMNKLWNGWKYDNEIIGNNKHIPGPFETAGKVYSSVKKSLSKVGSSGHSITGGYGGPKSHASGLSNVPYNGYQANLHKGERVLTPEENREYSKATAES